MALTWPVVIAVLCGALLHASWNALIKGSTDKSLDTALIHFIGSIIAIPLIIGTGWPVAAAWPYLVLSLIVHVGYYTTLSNAYQHGDLGITYPLMRGTAPLLVALSSALLLGESLSVVAWLGVLAVSAGVLVLGLGASAFGAPKAIRFALLNAVIIAIYTVVDALGVRASGNALQYVAALFLIDGWPFAMLVLARRGRAAVPYVRKRWPLATVGAAASLASYGVALWAMTRAPVATIAALRETSVLFAALLGVWFLGEVFTPRRVLGTCAIVAGVMALRLG